MARQKAKRQARKRSEPVLLLGKRLVVGKEVALGGGLTAELRAGLPAMSVVLRLRTRGAGDIRVAYCDARETGQAAAAHAEAVLVHLASALRQAGAS